ncbi:MAG: sugar ABC transporter ATP-binding protein [Treponema sp.]|jgi:ABC-type sugar transport system ATPase subunit|nr:sugar ABC transporter ATP-binding protein [Treponema sp.]
MAKTTVLEAKKITKQFPGVLALDCVDFTLAQGEVHALVGENGAGKSTLVQILSGVYSMDSGDIILNGLHADIRSPLDAQRLGIGIVFQELSLTPELSVAENMFPNRQPAARSGFIKQKELNKKAKEIIDIFSEDIDPATPVKYLTIAKQQMVEIMKALSLNPKVLILDEPTSSLTQLETEHLFTNVRQLQQRDISIIYISHHLSELFVIADRATILRDGRVVSSVMMKNVDEDKIISLMVGREVTHKHIDRSGKIDRSAVVFEAKNISHAYQFKNISFSVHKGEILGLSGLIGAGRSELAKAIFGLGKISGGEMYLNGKKIHNRGPSDAMKKGMAYTSESRKHDGLFLGMSIAHNCSCTQLGRFSNAAGFLNDKKIDDFSKSCIDEFKIISTSEKQLVRNLSGGNQQKVLLSMWLGIQPELLIVDEPTKGVDVGAKEEIYGIIRALADTGAAVIIISSDLLEILTISDRIAVLKDGRITGTMDIGEADEETIITYATGKTKQKETRL